MNLQKIVAQEMQLLPEYMQMEVFNFLMYLKDREHQQQKKQARQRPYFGCGAVDIKVSADFDEPLEDFKDYM